MNFSQFHNGLRKLANIDRHDLVEHGVIEADDIAGWERFRENPHLWFIRASDAQAAKVWKIMERRTAS